jgi:hypothetical protein
MAQTTRSSSTRARRTRSNASKSTSRNGSSRTSRTTRKNRNGRRRNSSNAAKARTTRTSQQGLIDKTGEKVAEFASKAKPPAASVRKTGEKVSGVASKAKTPLVAGGAALAGLAGGLALRGRAQSRRPVRRLKKVDLSKIDLDAITSAARRARAIGEQVGDIADAADKTRKKH